MEINHPDVIAVIPARYGSSRFPGKPLADIAGQPMVWRVFQRAAQALGRENVVVATDDERICNAVVSRGGNAVISNGPVSCGTERCSEAVKQLGWQPRVVVNIQGDEPFIDPADITRLLKTMDDDSVEIATLARRFNPAEGFEALFSPGNPKVTMDCNGNALYFSRSIIPYVRNHEWQKWVDNARFHIHVGTYAFRTETLHSVVSLPPSQLETAESLEQLRWLEAGYKIRVILTENHPMSVDTPEDLELILKQIK